MPNDKTDRRRQSPDPKIAIAACLLLSAACATSGSPGPPRPALANLVLVVIDTLRADHVGVDGYARGTTPHIDAFAERGAVFTQAVAQSSWTRPSMASLLTGLYPETVGVTCHNLRVPKADCDVLPESVTTLAETLAAHGIRGAGVVSNINVDSVFGFAQGYESMFVVQSKLARNDPHWRWADGLKSHTTRDVTNAAVAWLEDNARSNDRLFLYVHYLDPHAPYEPPEPHRSGFDPASYHVDPRSRQDVALYDGEIQFVDLEFEKVLRKLDELGLTETTGVVIVADHGEEFREHGGTHHGHTLYDEQLRVPLIMVLPGWTEPATRIEQQVRLLDVMPTVLEALGIERSPVLQGTSLMPLLQGRSVEPLPALAGWAYRPLVSWRHPPWKLIHDVETRGTLLFDLTRDPTEQRDLFDDHRDIAVELYDEMLETLTSAREAAELYPRSAGTVELSPGQIEQLRSLGYVD